MISRALTSLVSQTIKINQRNIFAFANVRQTLKKKLDQQIKYEAQNKPSVSQYVNFFNNNGWDINYVGTQVQLVRKNADYNLRVLFNARSPSTEEQTPQENQQTEQAENYNDDYSQISVYINKNGTTKWMCTEFFVTQQNSQMAGVRFLQNYENQRADRFKERNSSTNYAGPQIHSLQEVLSDNIGAFVQSVGIDHSLLQNAANFSVAFEHQFYLQWLKDIKTIL